MALIHELRLTDAQYHLLVDTLANDVFGELLVADQFPHAVSAPAYRQRAAALTALRDHITTHECLTKVLDGGAAEPNGAPFSPGTPIIQDALKWRALMNCPRIRVRGHSGFNEPLSERRHVGVEFSVPAPGSEPGNMAGRELLTLLADFLLGSSAPQKPDSGFQYVSAPQDEEPNSHEYR